MKVVIDIDKEVKQAFDCTESNDLKGCYYDYGGVIGAAIKNGKPLDEVFDMIKAEIGILSDTKCEGYSVTIYTWHYLRKKVIEIIDKYKSRK